MKWSFTQIYDLGWGKRGRGKKSGEEMEKYACILQIQSKPSSFITLHSVTHENRMHLFYWPLSIFKLMSISESHKGEGTRAEFITSHALSILESGKKPSSSGRWVDANQCKKHHLCYAYSGFSPILSFSLTLDTKHPWQKATQWKFPVTKYSLRSITLILNTGYWYREFWILVQGLPSHWHYEPWWHSG